MSYNDQECVDCSKLDYGRRAICEGRTDLPAAKRRAYLKRWLDKGLIETVDCDDYGDPVPRATKILNNGNGLHRQALSVNSAGQSGRSVTVVKEKGPGTELRKLFYEMGIAPCDLGGCEELANKMDTWGPTACLEKLDEIIDDIMPRAEHWLKVNHRFINRLIPDKSKKGALRSVIKKKVLAAIGLATPAPKAWMGPEHKELRDLLINDTEILVKSFMRHQLLVHFIKSVTRYYPTIKIRVVDDSLKPSQKPSRLMSRIQSMEGVSWHQIPYDSGLPTGRNVGLRESSAKYIILCDDDFVFTDRTDLYALLMPLTLTESQPLDICGGLVRWHSQQPSNWCGMLSLTGSRPNRMAVMKAVDTPQENVIGIPYWRCDITFNFFAAKRECLLSYPYDEQYKIGDEHLDSFLTWKEAGLKVAYTTASICDHVKTEDREYRKMRTRVPKENLLNKKWGLSARKIIGVRHFPID